MCTLYMSLSASFRKKSIVISTTFNNSTLQANLVLIFKVRGPFVQTLCIEKRLIYGRHLTCKYI